MALFVSPKTLRPFSSKKGNKNSDTFFLVLRIPCICTVLEDMLRLLAIMMMLQRDECSADVTYREAYYEFAQVESQKQTSIAIIDYGRHLERGPKRYHSNF